MGVYTPILFDFVVKALNSLVHIFGNTTLEFPSTIEYATRFRLNNPKAIFKIAKNKEQDFYSVCEDIGPPARMLRWCCFMFKTGPISRVINSFYRDKNILLFEEFFSLSLIDKKEALRYNIPIDQADKNGDFLFLIV